MSMTAIELCAIALLKIGANPIVGLADDSVEGECARRIYPLTLRALLSVHPWSFSMTQVQLAPEPQAPLADFGYSFKLPADHLRTISAGVGRRGRGLVYRVQGGRILTDAEAITLTYQRIVPEEELPPFFIQLLITRLAAEFCIPLTEGTSRAMELFRLAEHELRLARLIDSQQGTPQRVDDFTLVAARLS